METTTPSKSLWPAFVGAIALILLFAVIVRLFAGGLGTAVDEDAARGVERASALEALNVENKEKLETTAWADRAKGTVQIPIKQAMELTVAELAGQTPRAAGPIVPVAPAAEAPGAAPADAPATAPAETAPTPPTQGAPAATTPEGTAPAAPASETPAPDANAQPTPASPAAL